MRVAAVGAGLADVGQSRTALRHSALSWLLMGVMMSQFHVRRFLFSLLPLMGAFLLLASPTHAQLSFGSKRDAKFKYPVTLEAHTEPGVVVVGETVKVHLTATIDSGFHIYAMDVGGEGPVAAVPALGDNPFLEPIDGSNWTESKPKEKFDQGFQVQVRYHEGKVTFTREYKVAANAVAGEQTVNGTILMQVCDEKSCMNPRTTPFSFTLMVRNYAEGGASATPAATPIEATPTPEPEATPAPSPIPAALPVKSTDSVTPTPKPMVADKGDQGLVAFLLIALAAGFGALLTPCVFPMIPITISFFTKRAEDNAAARVKLSFVYGGTIVLGFAAIGLAFALAKLALGWGVEKAGLVQTLAANPWLNLGLTGLFVAFALSLFGLFDIQLPASWTQKLQQRSKGKTDTLGAAFMAIIFVIVSFTCTAPFVGLLLPEALKGSWVRPLAGMAAYGLGFALPFFVLGLLPGLAAAIPKDKSWLGAVKVVMGLLELALAFKFLSNVDLVWRWGIFTREILLAVWTITTVVITFYVFGKIRLGHDPEVQVIGIPRLMFGLLFGATSFYFAFGLFGGQLSGDLEAFMPPSRHELVSGASKGSGGSTGGDGSEHLDFIMNDLDAAFARAREENKPIFVDFTGWTCTNCRLMEKNMFPRPRVNALMKEFVRVQLYTDDATVGEKWQQYQLERFNAGTLPFYVILTPDDKVLATFNGLTRDEAEFLEFLRVGVSKPE